MISQRLADLRQWMRAAGLDVLVVATIDPHNSEYVAEHWKCRQWLTGFTGSAGTAIVSHDAALLWTDSRYWLQAAEQLADTPFQLMREGADIEPADWLLKAARTADACRPFRIGFPADMMTPELYADLFRHVEVSPTSAEASPTSVEVSPTSAEVSSTSVEVSPTSRDPFAELWTDRPALPCSSAELMPASLAGEEAAHKIERLADALAADGRNAIFLSDLSEICWLLNLRGADIPYNPFLICFFDLAADGRRTLYIDERQLTAPVSAHLSSLHVEVRPYAEGLARQQRLVSSAPQGSPVAALRAIKNPTEQEGFRAAHVRDGVAMVRFLAWLDAAAAATAPGDVVRDATGAPITEMTVDRVLTALRAEQPGFRGLSFETIAAYGPHGAIVHYEATPETDVPLQASSLLLLDSGAHYAFDKQGQDESCAAQAFCGTTDITRTIALGPLTDEERRVYTLVLKGHLQLAHLVFPEGTTGLQLDTAARMAMWREGYDFGHGTGHGVGHCLGVHEGPVQIRKNLRACTTLPFRAGQNITNEPGIYIAGRFGVRIENLLFVQPAEAASSPAPFAVRPGMPAFLRFEQHTLCPYDLRPVVVEMLTPDERRWLNDYHALVRQTLRPLLATDAERAWLDAATQAV